MRICVCAEFENKKRIFFIFFVNLVESKISFKNRLFNFLQRLSYCLYNFFKRGDFLFSLLDFKHLIEIHFRLFSLDCVYKINEK